MPSYEWERFMENYYGDPYMMWHDGIDESSVTRLTGEERVKAEDMLIESLREGSHYGAIGLRELRSSKGLPHLKEVLSLSTGTLKVEAAVALSVIEDTFSYVHEIIYVLSTSQYWSYRMDAARKLRYFPTDEVVEALFVTVAEDPDYLVRNHASETILFLHRLEPSISSYKEIFSHMIVDYDEEDESSKKKAFEHYKTCSEMLRKLIDEEGTLREKKIVEDIWSWRD